MLQAFTDCCPPVNKMRAVVQTVEDCSLEIRGKTLFKDVSGLLIYLGIAHGDTIADMEYIAGKCVNMRIFKDGEDKMNLSPIDVSASLIVISQFTLYGDVRKGRRPSFNDAAPPEEASGMYEAFLGELVKTGAKVYCGEFRAEMNVSYTNSGPVTILVDSKRQF